MKTSNRGSVKNLVYICIVHTYIFIYQVSFFLTYLCMIVKSTTETYYPNSKEKMKGCKRF